MNQFWVVERETGGVRFIYICNAIGREAAKKQAQRFLLGNPDEYVVTPLTNPGDVVNLQVNISAT